MIKEKVEMNEMDVAPRATNRGLVGAPVRRLEWVGGVSALQVRRWPGGGSHASTPARLTRLIPGRGGKPFLFLRHQVPDSEQPSFAFDPSPAPLRASS